MAYVGIDTQGARNLGQQLRESAARAEAARRQTVGALELADLTSQAPLQLALVQDGFTTLGAGLVEKAELAERFAIDPRRTAETMGTGQAELGSALAALLGFAGPRDLRSVLIGLPPRGRDARLDAALDRLTPALLPALLAGQRPSVPVELAPDLRLLAVALGIEHAGPPASAVPQVVERGGGFLGLFRRKVVETRTTEVFWQDFWSGGGTVADVLTDPDRLLDWVAGTFELDQRLSRAAAPPTLGDVLATHDFATANSDPAQVEAMIAAARQEFAAIEAYLPSLLAGRTAAAPDPTQLAQTLAFGARVGWTDPGAAVATPDARFAAAVAFLRANRMLQSALLPVGFEGDSEPLAFFNAPGIALTLQHGLTSGVIDSSYLSGLAGLVDRALATVDVDLTAATAAPLTEPAQQVLFGLVASQIPRSLVESPAIQAQFVAALSHLRGATSGPELRARIVEVVAAFRTLAVAGAPALTERELTAVVGANALGVLGRSRLRLRTRAAVEGSPEFLILARQFGIPGSRKQKLGKYTFGFTFDELGVLTDIARKKQKKKGLLGRIVDTVKGIGKAIAAAWDDNPFKAIFQVGKIALGVASLVVPGLQVVGLASLAVNAVEAVSHAIDGNWLGAIGAGLAAVTGGADILGTAAGAALITGQSTVLGDLFGNGAALEVLRNAKRAFDIGASVFQATRADSLAGVIGAGLGAAASALGNGGKLLESIDAIDESFARDLARLGTSVRDVSRLVTPAAGFVAALERGDALNAFASGLSVVSAGAAALGNPNGVLVSGTAFDFTAGDRATLASLATGSGIAANLARAVAATNAGSPFAAGQALAQAAQLANGLPRAGTVDQAEVAKRVAEVGIVLEAVFRGADPRLAAPVVLQRLNTAIASLRPASAARPTDPFAPVPVGSAPEPVDGDTVVTLGSSTLLSSESADLLVGGSGADTLDGGASGDLLLAQAPGGGGDGQVHIRFPDGTVISPQEGMFFVPRGAEVVTPDGQVYGGPNGLDLLDRGLLTVPERESIPGGSLDIPGFPNLQLFFPDDDERIPVSQLDLFGTTLSGGSGDDLLVGGGDDDEIGRIDLGDGLPFGLDPNFYERVPERAPLDPLELMFADPPTGEPPYVWAAADNLAFVPNHVLDGGPRTKEFILPFLGWGASARGAFEASESAYVGAKLGYALVDNGSSPVDGVTVGATASVGAQFGTSGGLIQGAGELNLGPMLDLELPTATTDYIAGGNFAPTDTTLGFRATNGETRWLESGDFSDARYVGPAVMLGVKYPIYGDLAVQRIAELAEVSEDDVLLAQQLPPGSQLAFDVRDGFGAPFDPGFAGLPGFPPPLDDEFWSQFDVPMADDPGTAPLMGSAFGSAWDDSAPPSFDAEPSFTDLSVPDGFSLDYTAPDFGGEFDSFDSYDLGGDDAWSEW
ncbi:hypothetical protein O7635_28170 [Asanoa sp. WMMD1127]|uniref:hypothetical protein n=1 Tax=Asanoa sp. WMMD1127 TaxID=3016107 RepID=UPI002417DB1E|nr:hypothetical protein [Asanoa sp. WMMD1127]MDG4825741.1 hypothetical protein [Asanoa sp. WMMD1127]